MAHIQLRENPSALSAAEAQEMTIFLCGHAPSVRSVVVSVAPSHWTDLDYDSRDVLKACSVDGQACLLNFRFPNGRAEHSGLQETWIRTAHGVMILYSTGDRDSFNEAEAHRDRVVRIKDYDAPLDAPIVLLSTVPPDAEREVSQQEGRELALALGCPGFETPADALDQDALDACFCTLIREIKKKQVSRPVYPQRKKCLVM